ncbi:MAG: 50S ribosomal protein L30 [Saprospiraceae bacterium]
MTSSEKKLQVKLVKSPIGYTKKQRSVVQSLGLRKIGQTVERADTPIIRGMINKVSHLLEITEINA